MTKAQTFRRVRGVSVSCHFGFWIYRVSRVYSTLNIWFLLHFSLSSLADVSRYLVCPFSLTFQTNRLLHRFETCVCDATLDSQPRRSLDCFQLLRYDFYCTSFSPVLQTFCRYLVCPFSLKFHKHKILHRFETCVCDATLESEPRRSLECF